MQNKVRVHVDSVWTLYLLKPLSLLEDLVLVTCDLAAAGADLRPSVPYEVPLGGSALGEDTCYNMAAGLKLRMVVNT